MNPARSTKKHPLFSDNRAFVRIKKYCPEIFIFFLAIGLRLFYLWQIKDTHFFSTLMGDSEVFDLWAREISTGNWRGDTIFFQAPLYPYFLGFVYTFLGKNLLIVRLIQIVIGSCSCLIIAKTGSYFFSRKIGLLAGSLLAVYPVAIYFDCLIQKAVIGFFFMALLLFWIGKSLRNTKWHIWSLTGVTAGCFILIRENALILVPVILFWIIIRFRHEQNRLIKHTILFLLGVSLVLFPVALRNKIVGGELVLTASNFGFNFYSGNSLLSEGTYTPLVWGRGDWRYESKDATRLAEKELGRQIGPTEVSNYWAGKTISLVQSNPTQWLRLMAKKWLLVFNAIEISDTESLYAHYKESGLLRSLGYFFHFGIICPLAVFGIGLTWKNRTTLWILYFILISYASGITLFFVFARFRHPMVAVLILFAAAGMIYSRDFFKKKIYRPVFICFAITVFSAILVNWKIMPEDGFTANTYYNLGCGLEAQDDLPEATRYYQDALQLNPNHVMAHNNMGVVFLKQGKPDKALSHLSTALRLKPDLPNTHMNMGICLFHLGRLHDALHHFTEVVYIDPDYSTTVYYNIACIYSQLNKVETSLQWLEKAVNNGYNNWDQIKTDRDLENLRRSPSFKKFIGAH